MRHQLEHIFDRALTSDATGMVFDPSSPRSPLQRQKSFRREDIIQRQKSFRREKIEVDGAEARADRVDSANGGDAFSKNTRKTSISSTEFQSILSARRDQPGSADQSRRRSVTVAI